MELEKLSVFFTLVPRIWRFNTAFGKEGYTYNFSPLGHRPHPETHIFPLPRVRDTQSTPDKYLEPLTRPVQQA